MATPPLATDFMDVRMSAGWDLVIDPARGIDLVAGEEAVAQAIRFRLQLLLKEWFLNQEAGQRWFEDVLGDASKAPGVEDRARAIARAAILDAPGVLSIVSLAVDPDAGNRSMQITYQANCGFGTTAVTTLTVGLAA